MKLHELSPAAGSVKERLGVKEEVQAPVTVKQQVRVTRVRTLVQAAVYAPDLKAVSFRFTESFLREALRTTSQQTTLS